jgi:cytochrome c-type biogenesis protein
MRLAFAVLVGAAALAAIAIIGASSAEVAQSAGYSLVALVPAAFLAGLLSFLSPCTLPILPAYFAFSAQARQHSAWATSLAFFGGLATTMSLIGASATALSRLLNQHLEGLTVVGGLVIIAFGLMSLFGVGFSGVRMQARPAATLLGAYLYGAVFTLGWSTCIGPILGAVLTLLATQGLWRRARCWPLSTRWAWACR